MFKGEIKAYSKAKWKCSPDSYRPRLSQAASPHFHDTQKLASPQPCKLLWPLQLRVLAMPSVLKIRKTNGIHDTGLFFSSSGVCQELGRGPWGQEELDGFGEAAKEGGSQGRHSSSFQPQHRAPSTRHHTLTKPYRILGTCKTVGVREGKRNNPQTLTSLRSPDIWVGREPWPISDMWGEMVGYGGKDSSGGTRHTWGSISAPSSTHYMILNN